MISTVLDALLAPVTANKATKNNTRNGDRLPHEREYAVDVRC